MVQELVGYYLVFKEFFTVENVRKAIAIDEHQPYSLTTSMVDDVFFMLQSWCRSPLSHEHQDALQQEMRDLNFGANLFLGVSGCRSLGQSSLLL